MNYEVPRNADTLAGELSRTPRRPSSHRLAGTRRGSGNRLISAVQCQMSHSQYFVVETDDYAKLHELFVPFQGIATADFTPVRDLMNL